MSDNFSLPYAGGLDARNLPKDILHGYEKIPAEIYSESRQAASAVADIIVNAINAKSHDSMFRLGLTTGTTPLFLYDELADSYRHGKVSFSNVEIVSIDEYYPFSKDEALNTGRRESRQRHIYCINPLCLQSLNHFHPGSR